MKPGFKQGLKLNKTIIANLNVPEMSNRNGGSGYWCSGQYCNGGGKTRGCTHAHPCQSTLCV
jgi:hypothetical protein